jgi:hypothetical protein
MDFFHPNPPKRQENKMFFQTCCQECGVKLSGNDDPLWKVTEDTCASEQIGGFCAECDAIALTGEQDDKIVPVDTLLLSITAQPRQMHL